MVGLEGGGGGLGGSHAAAARTRGGSSTARCRYDIVSARLFGPVRARPYACRPRPDRDRDLAHPLRGLPLRALRVARASTRRKVVLSPCSRSLAAALAVLPAFAPLALALDTVPAANQAAWEHLGMRRVNFRLDHDVILAATEGRVRSIRIVVAGGDLELFDVKITFGDGETFSPAARL